MTEYDDTPKKRLPGTKKGEVTCCYPVAVTYQGGRYHADCVDLPKCTVQASSIEAAMYLVKEAITNRLIDMVERKMFIWAPQYPEDYMETRPELQSKDIMWLMVPIDWSVIHSTARSVSITVPGHLLAQFDRYAKYAGISRSGFLVQAAVHFLEMNKRKVHREGHAPGAVNA